VDGYSLQQLLDSSASVSNGSFQVRGEHTDFAAVSLTAQTNNISATDLYAAAPPAGLYEVVAYLTITATGTTGTIVVNVGYTDELGATTQSETGIAITSTGRIAVRWLVYSTGVANIKYTPPGVATRCSRSNKLRFVARRIVGS